ncbi:MAG: heterodisulfide reductase-related iron-sulfur binding cluster [Bythopirellula sp.]
MAIGLSPAAEGEPLLTREVFGNVSKTSQTIFYLLAAAAVLCFSIGVYRRIRLWRLGVSSPGKFAFNTNLRRKLGDILLQKRMINRTKINLAHRLLFLGFGILFIGTILIAIEHVLADLLGRDPTNPLFHKGLYFAIYEVTLDLFGLAMLAGCCMFMIRRWKTNDSIGHHPTDWIVLWSFLLIGISGYATEGMRIIQAQTPLPGLSFVGYGLAAVFQSVGWSQLEATQGHIILWWIHAVLALGFIAALPYTRLLHAVAGVVNLSTSAEALGELQLVSLEELEATGRIGVGEIDHFDRSKLIQLDACVSCGRCEDACPAFEAGKPLSPRNVVQDVRAHLNLVGPSLLAASQGDRDSSATVASTSSGLHGDTISADTLWSCTTCGACADLCPLGVSPLGMITDMRRHLVGEGQLRGSPATSLQKSQRSGNPWGLPASDRFAWASDLEVPTIHDNPEFEYLYWVGCAAAYDRRIQNVARSVVKLLKRAEVSFAVLGSEEKCTGESARRMGDEFLFQELAAANVETLEKYNVRKIVAHCPHCVNSFLQDYPQMGGEYEVIHHSQLLKMLVELGRIPSGSADEHGSADASGSDDNRGAVVYHDPCYLARVQGVTEAPRQVIAAARFEQDASQISELPRNRRHTSCCGGGGGRMWFDDAPGERSGTGRVDEILESGASTVAVSCPFCMVMISDGIAAKTNGSEVRVKDISEILVDSIVDSAATD